MSGGLELQLIVTAGLILMLVVAGVSDTIRYVIPNSVVLAIVGLFFLAAFAASDLSWLDHLGAGAAVLAFGYLLFHYGLMGGGDVKLWAACALWTGLDLLPIHLVNVTVIGTVLAIALVLIRAALGRAIILFAGRPRHSLPRLFRQGEAVPYGVAIAAGTMLLAAQIGSKFA